MHLSLHEADAWCHWAGRRLLTASEWRAAQAQEGFAWGAVWEWVRGDAAESDDEGSDAEMPATPAPQLVGASFATTPRLRQQPATLAMPAGRNDGFWGFRSAAV